MMKIIRFTENEIVVPHHKMIVESMGVPNGIVEVAENLYNEFVDSMNSVTEKMNFYPIELHVDYKIADLNIKQVDINLKIEEFKELSQNDFEILQYSVSIKFKRTGKEKIPITNDFTKPSIKIRIGASENWELPKLIEFIKNKKNVFISSLTHELMHIYDAYKYPYDDARKRADYSAYQNLYFGIKPIDDLMHLLYFIHSIENVVRPSELSADIKLNKVSQKKFLEFLQNYETYVNLDKARKFSYNGLKKELKDYISEIDKLSNHIGTSFGETDEEKIEEVLRIVWVNIINETGDKYLDMVSSNILSKVLGVSEENPKWAQKYLRKLTKHDNAQDFFADIEKKFKFVSNKMIKKISKLYAMTHTNESIVNWELYHKTKGTFKKLVTELKFKK